MIQDVKFNISIAGLKRLVRGLVVNENEEIAVANRFKEAFDIRTPSVQTLVGTLSGGNQQKTAVVKWLYTEPDLLILDEPTRGIDVGAKFEIYTS